MYMQQNSSNFVFVHVSENIAFERACRQKEGHASQNVSLATDADIDTCSISKAGVPGWWTLTLDGVKRVESFTLITGKRPRTVCNLLCLLVNSFCLFV